jgi:hypothetical protein
LFPAAGHGFRCVVSVTGVEATACPIGAVVVVPSASVVVPSANVVVVSTSALIIAAKIIVDSSTILILAGGLERF